MADVFGRSKFVKTFPSWCQDLLLLSVLLQGLFINVDESNSQFHLLNNKFGSEPPKYVFNHSVF